MKLVRIRGLRKLSICLKRDVSSIEKMADLIAGIRLTQTVVILKERIHKLNLVGCDLDKYSLDTVKMNYMLCIQFNFHVLLGYGKYNPKWLNQVYLSFLNDKVNYV